MFCIAPAIGSSPSECILAVAVHIIRVSAIDMHFIDQGQIARSPSGSFHLLPAHHHPRPGLIQRLATSRQRVLYGLIGSPSISLEVSNHLTQYSADRINQSVNSGLPQTVYSFAWFTSSSRWVQGKDIGLQTLALSRAEQFQSSHGVMPLHHPSMSYNSSEMAERGFHSSAVDLRVWVLRTAKRVRKPWYIVYSL